MKSIFQFSPALVVLALASVLAAWSATPHLSPDAASMQRKIDHLDANARLSHPDSKPTVLTEQEINAYLASGEVDLPEGVQSVHLQNQSGTISGTAHVDFDKVREKVHSSNPLLSIFTGVHEVAVDAHAYGKNGRGFVHVDSVSLDGIEVPQFVLEIFVEKYITASNPDIGIDSKFNLPDRIDTATVGSHTVTLVQR